MRAKPDREGFITNWLVSGPKVEGFVIDNPFDDQLKFEKHMRGVLRDGTGIPAVCVPATGTVTVSSPR
jgi:hypothetical protein